jgi:uncharacterized protein (TIGR03382 family)
MTIKAMLLGVVLLVGAERVAHADGWIKCSGPDSNCNASGADSGAVGASLLLVAGVAYGLTRRKRR